jgi:hypothetical protein
MNTRVLIMYVTAMFAESKFKTTHSYSEKGSCEKIIDDFNRGEHILNKIDRNKSYSLIKTK